MPHCCCHGLRDKAHARIYSDRFTNAPPQRPPFPRPTGCARQHNDATLAGSWVPASGSNLSDAGAPEVLSSVIPV